MGVYENEVKYVLDGLQPVAKCKENPDLLHEQPENTSKNYMDELKSYADPAKFKASENKNPAQQQQIDIQIKNQEKTAKKNKMKNKIREEKRKAGAAGKRIEEMKHTVFKNNLYLEPYEKETPKENK